MTARKGTGIFNGSAACAALITLTNLAMAQTPAASTSEGDESTLQEVVVTGSRIQNSGLTSPTPLTVLTAETFNQTAPSAVDDIMAELPAFRASSGPNQVQRNTGNPASGQSTADLRGLGAPRTLLLINSQRWVPTNAAGTTSTSVVPVELVDRIEVVTGGASAAYGSDAVAGVTNIVLKQKMTGFKGSVFGGQSQQSDNEEFGFGIAGGFSAMGDRLHVVLGGDYNDNKGMGNIYTRDWSAVEPGNSGNAISFGATRAAGTPAFGWANGVEYAAQTAGGVITTARTAANVASTALNLLAFRPDGTTSTLVRGPVFGNLMINSSSNPIATPLAQWQLKQPLKRYTGMGRVAFDITPATQAYALLGYGWSNVFSQSQYHQTPTVTILATNPFLPAAMKAQMAAANLASFDMGRVDTEWLGTTGDNTLKTTQLSTGLKGTVGPFNWDLSYNYGKSTLDSHVYGTREANLAAAEYVVLDASGNPTCGPLATNPNFATARLTNTIQLANVQPGCVPLNPFGVGNSSQSARDYVAGIEYTLIQMQRRDVALNLTGQLFELPAGPLSAAVGLEYRNDALRQTADPLQILGVYSSGNAKTYSGESTVKEGYLEIEVPLLKDMALAKSFGLNSAVRRTNYDISGSVTTWKIGATYEPIESLRFRATRSRDIRAPSLSDLFLIGGISATGSFVNPFNGRSARLPVQTIGNAALVPERADTYSFGATFEARDGPLSGLRLSADFYRIKVRDVIASVGAADVLQRCFQGITLYCSAIQFDSSTFGISKILVQPFNQSLLDNQGVDIEAGYNTSLGAVPGSLDIALFATRLMHSKTTDRPGSAGVTIENAGVQSAAPKWVGSVFLNYRLQPVTIGLQARFFTPIRYSALNIGPGEDGYASTLPNSISKNIFAGMAYFNLNGTYEFNRGGTKFQVFANVSNLFDRDPPEFAIAAINLGGNPYDYIGRSFKLGVRFGL